MENTHSHDQTEFNKELEETDLLKSIRKNRVLQAPAGYYEHLNTRILDRINHGEDQSPNTRIVSIPTIARWTAATAAAAAAIAIFFFIGHESGNETRKEASLPSKPLLFETVNTLDSSFLESTALLSIDEQVLTEELITTAPDLKTDTSILQEELTEYLLQNADHDLLIESL